MRIKIRNNGSYPWMQPQIIAAGTTLLRSRPSMLSGGADAIIKNANMPTRHCFVGVHAPGIRIRGENNNDEPTIRADGIGHWTRTAVAGRANYLTA